MFMGPLEDHKPWVKTGIEGVFRFLNRVWRMIATDEGRLNESLKEAALTPEQEFVLHSTIKKVGEDIENLSFNTAIASMMIFVNEFTQSEVKPREAMEKFVICLYPFAPHLAEELWEILGRTEPMHTVSWPEHDESKTKKNSIEMVLQVNSKIKSKVQAPVDAEQSQIEEIAKNDDKVKRSLEGVTIRKVVFVKNKLINFIVG